MCVVTHSWQCHHWFAGATWLNIFQKIQIQSDGPFVRVPWLIHMCQDSWAFVTWLNIFQKNQIQSDGPFVRVPWLIHMCHDSWAFVTWLNIFRRNQIQHRYKGAKTQWMFHLDMSSRSLSAKGPLIIGLFCRKWPTKTYRMFHLDISFSAEETYVSGSFANRHLQRKSPYGVALVSTIDKIIGLLCKRALQKRRYSAKETCNFIDPTDRSHPICLFITQYRVATTHRIP